MERNGSQGTDNASVHINSKTRANASCAASPPPTLHQPLQVNSAANKSWLINYVEATLPRHIINALTSTQASPGENTHKHTNTHSHANRSLFSMRGAAHVATSTKIKSMPAAGLLPVTPSWTTSLLNTPLHAPCWISALKPSLANSWISSFFPEAEQTAKGHSGNKLFQSFYLYLPAFSLLPRLLFSSSVSRQLHSTSLSFCIAMLSSLVPPSFSFCHFKVSRLKSDAPFPRRQIKAHFWMSRFSSKIITAGKQIIDTVLST